MSFLTRIGLYGIHGTYNFGCEAILRGAVKFIKDRFENCEIVYFSDSYEYDKKALGDLDIKIVQLENKRTVLVRAVNKALRTVNCEKLVFTIPFKEIMDQIDVVFSIGGDIYTIPAYLREKGKYPYYNHLVDFCNRAKACGKRVIVYGASVGPFGGYQKAVGYYVKNLRKYEKILCREQESVDYLKSLGLDNITFFPDPAFTVRLAQGEATTKQYIGVNLSPLSFGETNGSYGKKEIKTMASLMDRLIDESNEKLLFIPHVVSESPGDNDYLFLKKIYDEMTHKEKVSFADYSGGFLGIKKQLRECRIVISARMHCAINAICECIPTIFLSYSQKSIGMCKYVYGNEKWVIKLKDVNTDLMSSAKELLDTCAEVSRTLARRNKEILEEITYNQPTLKIGEEELNG